MFRDKSLFIRVISAILGGLFLLGVYWLKGAQGLVLISLLASLLSLREFKRLLFLPTEPVLFSIFFSLLSLALVLFLFIFRFEPLISFSVANSVFAGGMIICAREKVTNDRLLKILCLGIFGFFYCVLCPWLAADLAQFEHGSSWFLFLLLVVFAGDTFAYFGGRFFGRIKLNPSLSPKKTLEGAIAGILGSLVASLGFWALSRPDLSPAIILVFGLLSGVIGQTGDLLMSLIKRVSQVKDSGRLFPGHGGVLDRIDGVLLVCPLVHTLATLVH